MPIPFSQRICPTRKQASFAQDDYFVWGASPVLGEDGRYHLFASRWPRSLTFHHWATASEVVRASADSPEGPYRFEEVVFTRRDGAWDGRSTHNPCIRKHGDTFLLFYTGIHYDAPYPTSAADGGLFSPIWLEAWNSKRVGLATSKSVLGPWQRRDAPILLPRPGHWDSVITSNPAPCVREDGSITLIYKSTDVRHPPGHFPGRFHQGVAFARDWNAPFERPHTTPVTLDGNADTHIEDACLWHNGEDYELIIKDMTGEVCGEAEAGIHACSRDGYSWSTVPPIKAYSRNLNWDDGTRSRLPKYERPQVLLGDGQPAYLFAATFENDAAGNVLRSWNTVTPLKS